MSNIRAIVWLCVLVVLLAGANLFIQYCGGSKHSIVKKATLAEYSPKLNRLEISRKNQLPTVITKSENWRLVEPYSGSVDEQVVMRFIDALSLTTIDDSLSDAELLKIGRTRADFALEDPVLEIALGDGQSTQRILFGSRTPTGAGIYAAVKGIDAVFTVSTNILEYVDIPTERFRRRSLFPVGSDLVSSFDIKRSSVSVLGFSRDGEFWKIGDSKASANKVREFVSSIVNSVAVGFVWPVGATNESDIASSSLLAAYGLDPESAITVTLKCMDGLDRQISFGMEAENGLVYALAQNSGAIVTVDGMLKAMAQRDAVMYTDTRLFPYDAASVTSFTIADKDLVYVIARQDDGWRMDSPVSANADNATANLILDRMLSLSSDDIRSDGIKISVTTNSEPVTIERNRLLDGTRLEDLRSKDILKIDPAIIKRIVQVSKEASSKPVSVTYSRERRAWNLETEDNTSKVCQEGIEVIISVVSHMKAKRVECIKVDDSSLARYGLDNPYLKIAVDLDREDAIRKNILIGASTNGGRYATIGSADAVFVVDNETVSKLFSSIVE